MTLVPFYDSKGITIYHGDCRDILPALSANSIDFILTDPPYGHNNLDGDLAQMANRAMGKGPARAPEPIANDGPEANELVKWFFNQTPRLLVPGGCVACCCAGGGGKYPKFAHWSIWLDEALGFKQMVIWDKGGLGLGWHYHRNYEVVLVGEKKGARCKWYGGRTQPNIFRIKRVRRKSKDHPTPKPPDLMRKFIQLHSAPGDLVLDPFMGHGTTLAVARQEGRRAIGIEIEERYCRYAAEQLDLLEKQTVIPFEGERSLDGTVDGPVSL